jgi:hypothetical protein
LAALRTRGSLRGRVRHSISRPATIAVFGGLVVAAVLVDWRLLVVAATAYVALVAITFFDEAEPVRKASSAVGRGAE